MTVYGQVNLDSGQGLRITFNTSYVIQTGRRETNQGKQFDSQIKPHIVGPDLRAKPFAVGSIFVLKNDNFFSFEKFLQQTKNFKLAANITKHTIG